MRAGIKKNNKIFVNLMFLLLSLSNRNAQDNSQAFHKQQASLFQYGLMVQMIVLPNSWTNDEIFYIPVYFIQFHF